MYLLQCTMKINVCDIPGCHINGTREDLEEHAKLQAPQHVKLPQSNAAYLTDTLVQKVTYCKVWVSLRLTLNFTQFQLLFHRETRTHESLTETRS